MGVLIPVTEETNRQGVNDPFVSKLYGIPFINKIRENGAKSTIILDGKRCDEERIVSESKSTIDALVNSGYLDFMFNLTVKNTSGSLNDDYPYSISLTASQIVEVYEDSKTPSDSIIRYRDDSKQEDTLYTVDEDLAAITALMPSIGGGGGSTELGNSIFVSSKGKTVAGGAVRESLTDHFSSLDEAIVAAQSGDTIFSYDDQSTSTNLVKSGVKYHFLGNSTITWLGAGNMIDDLGVDQNIIIKGNANFRCALSGRKVILIQGTSTHYDIECNSISGLSIVCDIRGGDLSSYINAKTSIISSPGATNWTIQIRNNGMGRIVCPYIDSFATNGIRQTVKFRDQNEDFTIIGDIYSNTFNTTYASATIDIEDIVNTNTLFIEGDIYQQVAVDDNSFWAKSTIIMVRGKLNLKGNIFGQGKYCLEIAGSNNTFKQKGNMINNGARACIFGSSNAEITFNGIMESSGASDVVVTNQTGGFLDLNGSIINSHTPGTPTTGLNLGTSASYNVVLRTIDILISEAAATPFAITAASNKDIKVFHSVGSNVGYNNITNLITGTSLLTDSDYL